MRIVTVIFAFLLFSVCGGAAIAQEPQKPARLALLIGNKAYSEKVGPLVNPPNDVAILKNALEELGFDVQVVSDATYAKLDQATRIYAQKVKRAGPRAISFFYYAGHGAVNADGNINYLVPVDATDASKETLWEESLEQSNVIERLTKTAGDANHILVFDACRDELRLKSSDRSLGSNRGFEPAQGRDGVFIAYSTAEKKSANDSGLYAKILAEELARPGVEVVQVFRNAHRRVRASMGQTPWVSEQASFPEIVLKERAAPEPPPVAEASAAAPSLAAKLPPDLRRYASLPFMTPETYAELGRKFDKETGCERREKVYLKPLQGKLLGGVIPLIRRYESHEFEEPEQAEPVPANPSVPDESESPVIEPPAVARLCSQLIRNPKTPPARVVQALLRRAQLTGAASDLEQAQRIGIAHFNDIEEILNLRYLLSLDGGNFAAALKTAETLIEIAPAAVNFARRVIALDLVGRQAEADAAFATFRAELPGDLAEELHVWRAIFKHAGIKKARISNVMFNFGDVDVEKLKPLPYSPQLYEKHDLGECFQNLPDLNHMGEGQISCVFAAAAATDGSKRDRGALLKVVIFGAAGMYGSAIDEAQDFIASPPSDQASAIEALNLVKTFYGFFDFDSGLVGTALQTILQIQPDNYKFLAEYGDFQKDRDVNIALDHYKKALKSADTDDRKQAQKTTISEIYNEAAREPVEAKDYVKALAYYELALKYAPDDGVEAAQEAVAETKTKIEEAAKAAAKPAPSKPVPSKPAKPKP